MNRRERIAAKEEKDRIKENEDRIAGLLADNGFTRMDLFWATPEAPLVLKDGRKLWITGSGETIKLHELDPLAQEEEGNGQ
jgi:hypothetical protein